MKIAAISCARMASTRFPGKCLALLNGKPLIQYTIDFAKEIKIPLCIFTRDIEIMEYVKDKCPIIYEPIELYDTKHNSTLEKMQFANKIINADYLILLQPTQPIRDRHLINKMIETTINIENDYVYSGGIYDKPDGRIYIYSKYYLNIGFCEKVNYFMSKEESYFDIDTKEDLEACEKWLQKHGSY